MSNKPYDEADTYHLGRTGGTFYGEDLLAAQEARRLRQAPHIVRAEDQVWEQSPQGLLKYISHPKLNPHCHDIDAYIQVLPPDGRSGKRRQMAEEFIFFLEGRGFSLHWDVELGEMKDSFTWKAEDTPQRFEWEAGDWMYVPINTITQHFNVDGEEPARLLSATSRVYKFLGCHDLEQIEPASPWHGEPR